MPPPRRSPGTFPTAARMKAQNLVFGAISCNSNPLLSIVGLGPTTAQGGREDGLQMSKVLKEREEFNTC